MASHKRDVDCRGVGTWTRERELKHAAKEGEITLLPRLYNQSKGKICYTIPSK